MRSRNASAAALYQLCRVASPVSLPIASVSLARMALLISASASSSTGACSGGYLVGCGSGNLSVPESICRESYADRGWTETRRHAVVQRNSWLFMQGPGLIGALRERYDGCYIVMKA